MCFFLIVVFIIYVPALILRKKIYLSDNPDILSKYTDSKCKELRKKISKKFNCEYNKIICGSGSDEIIQMLCQLFLKVGDEVIVPAMTHVATAHAVEFVGAKPVFSINVRTRYLHTIPISFCRVFDGFPEFSPVYSQ